MKSQLILGVAFSALAAHAFAQPFSQSAAQNQAPHAVTQQLMAEGGSAHVLPHVAQERSERTLNRVAQDGSERTLIRVAEYGANHVLNNRA